MRLVGNKPLWDPTSPAYVMHTDNGFSLDDYPVWVYVPLDREALEKNSAC